MTGGTECCLPLSWQADRGDRSPGLVRSIAKKCAGGAGCRGRVWGLGGRMLRTRAKLAILPGRSWQSERVEAFGTCDWIWSWGPGKLCRPPSGRTTSAPHGPNPAGQGPGRGGDAPSPTTDKRSIGRGKASHFIAARKKLLIPKLSIGVESPIVSDRVGSLRSWLRHRHGCVSVEGYSRP